jgi:hypothetical protein
MADQYRKFRIILKSGKEFEVKLEKDLKKMNNNEILEQFVTGLDQGNMFVFDKSVVRNSEIAAIVDITEEQFDTEQIKRQSEKDLEEITGKKFNKELF